MERGAVGTDDERVAIRRRRVGEDGFWRISAVSAIRKLVTYSFYAIVV